MIPGEPFESNSQTNLRASRSIFRDRSSSRPLLRQQNVLAIENDFIPLVQHFTGLHNATQTFALRILLLFLDGDTSAQRVSDENRLGETQLVITVGEGGWIDLARREPDADGEGHGAVSDALAKSGPAGKLRVDVMREVISRVPGMNDHIGLGNGTP